MNFDFIMKIKFYLILSVIGALLTLGCLTSSIQPSETTASVPTTAVSTQITQNSIVPTSMPVPTINSPSILGTFVNEKNPKNYFEFRPDGSFITNPGDPNFPSMINRGTYEVSNDKLRIFYPDGIAYEFTINGTSLIVETSFGVPGELKESRFIKK